MYFVEEKAKMAPITLEDMRKLKKKQAESAGTMGRVITPSNAPRQIPLTDQQPVVQIGDNSATLSGVIGYKRARTNVLEVQSHRHDFPSPIESPHASVRAAPTFKNDNWRNMLHVKGISAHYGTKGFPSQEWLINIFDLGPHDDVKS